jgi:hypothetical protein
MAGNKVIAKRAKEEGKKENEKRSCKAVYPYMAAYESI